MLAEWLTGRRLHLLNDKLSLVADCAIEGRGPRRGAGPSARPERIGPRCRLDRFRAGQARQPRADRALRSRPGLRLRGGDDRRRPVPEPPEIRAGPSTTCSPSARRPERRTRSTPACVPRARWGRWRFRSAAFERYLRERAETWERMAWTRCRHVGGDPALAAQVRETVDGFVYGPWSSEIPGYARHVRSRIERELAREAAGDHLDLKRGPRRARRHRLPAAGAADTGRDRNARRSASRAPGGCSRRCRRPTFSARSRPMRSATPTGFSASWRPCCGFIRIPAAGPSPRTRPGWSRSRGGSGSRCPGRSCCTGTARSPGRSGGSTKLGWTGWTVHRPRFSRNAGLRQMRAVYSGLLEENQGNQPL